MEFERWAWTAKHQLPMQTYEVSCPVCDITYHMEASELRELYCPLCENQEPVKATVFRDTKKTKEDKSGK